MPHLATVTYLNDFGSPTLMAGIRCPLSMGDDVCGEASEALLSRPETGKHVAFDGGYLHAAPSELSIWDPPGDDGAATHNTQTAPEQRLTLLVNCWLNWRPRDAIDCPMSIRSTLGKADGVAAQLAGHETSPIPAVSTAGDSTALRWSFRHGQQSASVRLQAPLEAIRRMEKTSMLLQGKGVVSLVRDEQTGKRKRE